MLKKIINKLFKSKLKVTNIEINKEVLDALRFYASDSNWIGGEHPFSGATTPCSALLDKGEIAKKTIELLNENNVC